MCCSRPVMTAGLHSGFSWSHLWSHSCKFSGVRSGLPSLDSGATESNRTRLNHQPQTSKAREGQPSAGSNPAATASLTRPSDLASRLGLLWSSRDAPIASRGRRSRSARTAAHQVADVGPAVAASGLAGSGSAACVA